MFTQPWLECSWLGKDDPVNHARLTHVPFLAVDERLDAPFSFFIHAVRLGLALCAAVVVVTIYHS